MTAPARPRPAPPDATRARRAVGWVILLGSAGRIATAATIGLGVDETYEVVVSRQLSAGYFDHPPLSFWIAHAASSLGGERALVVRAPFILLFAATTWLVYRLAARLFGERAGAVAALVLNITPVFAVSTGGWVLPDGPLACALVAAAYCFARAVDPDETAPTAWWLGTGVCAGFALLSKYHAALFLAGAAAYLCTRAGARRWWARPEPYVAAAIALAIFFPDIQWNAHHHWVSFAFQLDRGAALAHPTPVQRLAALGQNVVGQALWVLPWIWIPLVVVLVRSVARRPVDDRVWLLACLGGIPILVFTLVSLGGRPGLPHWPAPGWLLIIPLLGGAVAARLDAGDAGARRWLVASTSAFAALVLVLATATTTGWVARAAPGLLAHGDPTLEALDWTDLPRGLDSLGLLGRERTFVAATSWIQAAKAAYALGPSVTVVALTNDPREFQFLYDADSLVGRDAVIVDRLPARHDLAATLAGDFGDVHLAGRVPIHRFGRRAFDVAVYLAHDYRGPRLSSTPP